MKYVIHSEDYQLAVTFAAQQWSNRKPGDYGRGFANNPDDPYRVSRVATLAEIAFARMYGLTPDLEPRPGGDLGYDFVVSGLTIDIKTSMSAANYDRNEWVFRHEGGALEPLKADIYVGSQLLHEDRNRGAACIEFMGWISRQTIIAEIPDLANPESIPYGPAGVRPLPEPGSWTIPHNGIYIKMQGGQRQHMNYGVMRHRYRPLEAPLKGALVNIYA